MASRLRAVPLLALAPLAAPRAAAQVETFRGRGPVAGATKISNATPFLDTPDDLDDLDELARSAVFLGDLDGDGLEDLAVGAPGAFGTLGILSPLADGTVAERRAIANPELQGDRFGSAVAPLGDLDGDGVPDVVVGAEQDGCVFFDQGAVWILFLNADGTVKAQRRIAEGSAASREAWPGTAGSVRPSRARETSTATGSPTSPSATPSTTTARRRTGAPSGSSSCTPTAP